MTFDPQRCRADFPIFQRRIHDQPLVFLDSAASAQKPQAVIDAMAGLMQRSYANVHRGLYTLANEATEAFEAARQTAVRYLNAAAADEIVFTKGATEGLNLLAHGLGTRLTAGDEVIIPLSEHHANIVPWHMLRQRLGIVIRWAPLLDDGALDMAALRALISERIKVISISQMSNVLGVDNDVATVCAWARAAGAVSIVDGCQGAVHLPTDVQAMGCDAYVCSGHKLYGPTGIGLLYGRSAFLADLPPYQGGGEMITHVGTDRVDYAAPPHRFEAGTPAIVEAAGLDAALRYLMAQDRAAIAVHEHTLGQQLRAGLRDMGARLLAPAATGAIVSVAFPRAHPHDVAQILDQYGVCARAGSHCAEPLHTHLGLTASLRLSVGLYSTPEDITAALTALHKALRMLDA